MSADIGPHVYKPLPTAHCAECLGTRRNDFCQDEGVDLQPSWASSWAICLHGAYADLCITCHPGTTAAVR